MADFKMENAIHLVSEINRQYKELILFLKSFEEGVEKIKVNITVTQGEESLTVSESYWGTNVYFKLSNSADAINIEESKDLARVSAEQILYTKVTVLEGIPKIMSYLCNEIAHKRAKAGSEYIGIKKDLDEKQKKIVEKYPSEAISGKLKEDEQ
jgi:hypothetical protein